MFQPHLLYLPHRPFARRLAVYQQVKSQRVGNFNGFELVDKADWLYVKGYPVLASK
jgi:hypothetical protein